MNHNFGVIVWGHDTRLSALAAHPDHEIGFVTTGYDKMVTRCVNFTNILKAAVS